MATQHNGIHSTLWARPERGLVAEANISDRVCGVATLPCHRADLRRL
jgi:hypothetical protein